MGTGSDFVIENGRLMEYRGFANTVIIPDEVTTIYHRAFFSHPYIKTVIIPKGVTTIGIDAFARCPELRSVTIPDGVTVIRDRAFYGCVKLDNVTIPGSVTSIDRNAFAVCESLTSMVIPEGVTTIGFGAFIWCKNLENLTIPHSVTTIEQHAFFGCQKLKNLTLPEQIPFLSDSAFSRCNALADPQGLIVLNHILYDYCGSSGHVRIPEDVTTISLEAVFHWSDLECLYVPESFQQSLFDLLTISGTIKMIVAPGYTPEKIGVPQKQISAALGYLTHSALYRDDAVIKAYQDYVAHQKAKLLPLLFQQDLAQGLDVLAGLGKISPYNFEAEYLQPALEAHATNCVAFLLDWKNRNLPPDGDPRWNLN